MTKTEFQLRLSLELRRAIRKAAFEAGISMNKFILEAIERAIANDEQVANNERPPKLFFPEGF